MRAAAAALVAIAALGGGAGAVSAAPWTAEELRDACADGDLYYIYGACAGYVLGVHDRHLAEFGGKPAICMPAETTVFVLNEAIDAALPGLQPIEGESGAGLALRALVAAFPCD